MSTKSYQFVFKFLTAYFLKCACCQLVSIDNYINLQIKTILLKEHCKVALLFPINIILSIAGLRDFFSNSTPLRFDLKKCCY